MYYALTVFLSAFLLFQVQPLIGKVILPWFGGTPSVWSTAMLFFQILLMGGYAYAYGLVNWLNRRKQGGVHLALLAVSLGLLLVLWFVWDSPITPGARWKPQTVKAPQWHTLQVLAIAVGLPYFVLATSNPLMQSWFSHHHPERSPYRLYVLSNAGSLLGLITYPFLVEPVLALRTQAHLWALGYALFVACAAYGAFKTVRLDAAGVDGVPKRRPEKDQAPPRVGVRVFWVALAACAVVMLLATTNQISQRISVNPFIWILPLGLYLLSFMLCFSVRRWYSRVGYTAALFVATILFCWVFYYGRQTLLVQIGVYALVLFICCMICHGELARLKPHPRYLVSFYLLVAAGGVLGGVAVNLIAPHVFTDFLELPLGLLGCWLLLLIASAGNWRSDRGRRGYRVTDTLQMGGIAVLGVMLFLYVSKSALNVLWSSRNFYGVLWVQEANADRFDQHTYTMVHNATLHGFQYLDEEKSRLPTAYYTEEGGGGLAILHHPRRGSGLRVGVIGLGVGTMAAYGQPGDTVRFYEINPDVIRLAEGEGGYFTYLQDSAARVEIVPGDARISMERELAAGDRQRFDVLIVDAFSSDSIPVHLLTKEAFDVYLGHLQPDGVIALHISNHYMDLRPVVQGLADYFRLGTAVISDDGESGRGRWSTWVLATSNSQFLELREIAQRSDSQETYAGFRLWTDDYSSVFQALDRGQPRGFLERIESP